MWKGCVLPLETPLLQWNIGAAKRYEESYIYWGHSKPAVYFESYKKHVMGTGVQNPANTLYSCLCSLEPNSTLEMSESTMLDVSKSPYDKAQLSSEHRRWFMELIDSHCRTHHRKSKMCEIKVRCKDCGCWPGSVWEIEEDQGLSGVYTIHHGEEGTQTRLIWVCKDWRIKTLYSDEQKSTPSNREKSLRDLGVDPDKTEFGEWLKWIHNPFTVDEYVPALYHTVKKEDELSLDKEPFDHRIQRAYNLPGEAIISFPERDVGSCEVFELGRLSSRSV